MNPFIIDFSTDFDNERAGVLFMKLKTTFTAITKENNFLSEISNVEATIKSLNDKQINLLFIHKSNANADTLISQLPDNIWTVVYSGGGISQGYSQANIAAYKGVFDTRNSQDFLDTVDKVINVLQSDQSIESKTTEFKKIFGFDPVLNSKLNFLHQCLTPDGLETATIDASWNAEIQFEALKKADDGPFGENYIKALTTLRDKLLAS